MGDFKDLIGYRKAYELAMEVFHTSKQFPPEEKFSLTSQIRRCSRSVCTNLAEAYRRRIYPSHFVANLTDCEAENTETEVWIDFAKDCGYINLEIQKDWHHRNAEVRKLIYYMINNPDKFC